MGPAKHTVHTHSCWRLKEVGHLEESVVRSDFFFFIHLKRESPIDSTLLVLLLECLGTHPEVPRPVTYVKRSTPQRQADV